MKKILLWMFAAILTCGSATVFTACNDDEVEDFVQTVNLVGTWKGVDLTVTPKLEDDVDIYLNGGTVTFNSDFSVVNSDGHRGSWNLKDKIVTITWVEGEQIMKETFTINEYSRDEMTITSSYEAEDDNGNLVKYTVKAKLIRVN